jgi:hypothetical protein
VKTVTKQGKKLALVPWANQRRKEIATIPPLSQAFSTNKLKKLISPLPYVDFPIVPAIIHWYIKDAG